MTLRGLFMWCFAHDNCHNRQTECAHRSVNHTNITSHNDSMVEQHPTGTVKAICCADEYTAYGHARTWHSKLS